MIRSGLRIEIDGQQIRSLADSIGVTDEQLRAAMRSTYGKMARWLRTRGIRGVSHRVGVQQKILRGRVRAFRMANGIGNTGEGAKVWFGLRPIPAIKLGRPRKAGDGVRVGKHHFAGAFVANYGGRMQVLARVGEARNPLRVVKLDIEDASTTYIEDNLVGTAEFDSQFFKFLEHELKWRMRILA